MTEIKHKNHQEDVFLFFKERTLKNIKGNKKGEIIAEIEGEAMVENLALSNMLNHIQSKKATTTKEIRTNTANTALAKEEAKNILKKAKCKIDIFEAYDALNEKGRAAFRLWSNHTPHIDKLKKELKYLVEAEKRVKEIFAEARITPMTEKEVEEEFNKRNLQ